MGTGVAAGLLTREATMGYGDMIKPAFAPPGWLFPVVWTILYVLMGISAYLIQTSTCQNKQKAYRLYLLQLAVNFLWPIIFFNLSLYTFAFIWILLLWVLIIAMIVMFFKCDRLAAYLQIPYLVWVTFATVLTYTVAVMN